MKKQFTLMCFCTVLSLFVVTQASAQNDKGKGKKEDKKESHSKGKSGKNNSDIDKDKIKYKDDHAGKNHKNNNGNGKNANDEKGNHKLKDWKEKGKDGYTWNRENFKDRDKIKNKDKVTLCHKFKSNDEPGVTLRVSAHALQAHLNHGDVRGECPSTTTSRYSENFLGRRTEYYNSVQNTHEQVSYSRSVLDYAIERLTASRQQLMIMQNNNTPVQVIEQKKATVVELEQNVSLLETLIGVAVNVVANKLQ